LIFFFLAVSRSIFAFQCPLLESESFFEYYENIELNDFSKKKKTSNSERLKNFKYKDKIDSLFIYAKTQLKLKLPDSIICNRVAPNETYSLLSFYKHNITLNFSFSFSNSSDGKYGEVLHLGFNHIVKENKNYLSISPYPNQLPNCILKPELCSFKVHTEQQAIEIARSVGFLKPNEKQRVTSSKRQTYSYEITKTINDDCGIETILIDMYTGNHKIIVEKHKFGCITWKQKIDNSDVVVDGTIVNQKGIRQGRDINTQSIIEIHHLFKGKVNGDSILVNTIGGTLNGQSQFWSHGQISMKDGERAIYFLRSKNTDTSSSRIVYETNLDPFKIYRSSQSDKYRLYSEDYFQRIENIVGQNREAILRPHVKHNTYIPDDIDSSERERGIALRVGTKYTPGIEDSTSLYFSISSVNDLVYLDNWSINVEYDTIAFGSYIVKNKNIIKLETRPLFKNILMFYSFDMADIASDKIQLTWKKNDTHMNFLELIPLNKGNQFYQFIARLQLKVKNENQAYNLKSQFARPPIYYDYDQQKLDSILLYNNPKTISNSLADYFLPEIISFAPMEAHLGDTITITGKRLDGATLLLYGINGIRKLHHQVREQFIISHTSESIQFVVPPFLHYNAETVDPEKDHYKVSSGIINLRSKFANKWIASKEQLVILPEDN
jgi:hypothetical protein